MRTVDRQDINPCDHLIKAFPIGCLQLFFYLGPQTAAIVIVHLHPKRASTSRDGLTNSTHPQDA